MSAVSEAQSTLNAEAESEAAKFGEDVKYLADFTNSTKKFEPWIKKAEEKVDNLNFEEKFLILQENFYFNANARF